MKKLSCKELGADTCDFVAEGETTEEVKSKMFAHAAEAHAEKMEGMSEEEKEGMDKKMTSLIESRE